MTVPTDQMYQVEMKGLMLGSNNPRSVFRARATASCPQDVWGDKSKARIEWRYFRVNRIRTHGVTDLRHLGLFAGTSSVAQGMSANEG